jgi:hypothetical protein
VRLLLPFCAALLALASPGAAASSVNADLGLMPRPSQVEAIANCTGPRAADVAAALSGVTDPGAREIVLERWTALGIHVSRGAGTVQLVAPLIPIGGDPQAYTLAVSASEVSIASVGAAGRFYGFVTLAQLARKAAGTWRIPCIRIDDAPALRWRILSDDVSRGPLPTMRYFKERIRTIAAFKMNGYSPYMEHVFADPKHPLPAPLDGITPSQLRELATYAERFHVAFIPEQQTFAHMHGVLRWEENAPLAELPHGYLISPGNPVGEAHVRDLLDDELAALPKPPPFFHIGSDEPVDLGRGLSKSLVEADGEGPVYTKHVVDTAKLVVARSPRTRPMIWDDAVVRHPELFAQLPKQLVFVNWHYGAEKSYIPYIRRIANGGFEQMVDPGDLNWNEIYPNLDETFPRIALFLNQGKSSHVLGLFQTVWHDDGETLFEATWYPVLYSAASAWEAGDVDQTRFARDFPFAFFGTADAGYARDLTALGRARALLNKSPREYGDYLFWTDPLDPGWAGLAKSIEAGALRLAAEQVIAHLKVVVPPPLHANAAAVMELAALRYDALGRNFQIADEARAYYDDARVNADGKHDDLVYRNLNVTKYLFWEERDTMLELEPLVRRAWEYENRPSHEPSVLERYHIAADRAIERADRIDAATYQDYAAHQTLPTFDDALGLTR